MRFLTNWIQDSSLFNKPDGAAGLSQMQTVYAAFAVCWVVFLIFDWTGIDLPRKKLKRKDTVDWHSRVISSIHAIILCVGEASQPASVQCAWQERLPKGVMSPSAQYSSAGGNCTFGYGHPWPPFDTSAIQVLWDAMWSCKG